MTFNSLNDMSNFLVSARKYRPVSFKDVVGQETITTTLKNAITNNKLAQALLFTGPRGVGKTSCARIVAREINGFEINDDNSYNIFIKKNNEVLPWKKFNSNMAISIEYDLEY